MKRKRQGTGVCRRPAQAGEEEESREVSMQSQLQFKAMSPKRAGLLRAHQMMPSSQSEGSTGLAKKIPAESNDRRAAQSAGQLHRSDQSGCAGSQVPCEYFYYAEVHGLAPIGL